MATPEERRLVEEAKEIFLRLLEDPKDGDALDDKAAFIARGRAEEIAWDRIARVWKARDGLRKPRKTLLLPFLLLVSAGLVAALMSDDLRVRLVADAVSDLAPERVVLASGDGAHLDAGSALIDETEDTERHVTLIEGALFVEPRSDASRPFIVTAGPLTARAVGTAFEVVKGLDGVSVSVLEGIVEVRVGAQTERLEAGERYQWDPETGGFQDTIDPGSIAAWRDGRLLADRLDLAEAAAIIDRRISGRVIVIGDGQTRISGTFDLTRPVSALRAMASVEGARVIAAPPLLTVVLVP